VTDANDTAGDPRKIDTTGHIRRPLPVVKTVEERQAEKAKETDPTAGDSEAGLLKYNEEVLARHRKIAQFFSAVGYVYKRRAKVVVEGQAEQEVTKHAVLFQGASKYLVKPCDPLADVEVCDVSNWIERITADPTTSTPVQNLTVATSEPTPPAVTTEATNAAPVAAPVDPVTPATAGSSWIARENVVRSRLIVWNDVS
jgi:hypothetical protein